MGTISISLHRWRGASVSHELFMAFVVLGFITVGVSWFVLQEKLAELRETLRRLRGDGGR